jgi:hypothetical protein
MTRSQEFDPGGLLRGEAGELISTVAQQRDRLMQQEHGYFFSNASQGHNPRLEICLLGGVGPCPALSFLLAKSLDAASWRTALLSFFDLAPLAAMIERVLLGVKREEKGQSDARA